MKTRSKSGEHLWETRRAKKLPQRIVAPRLWGHLSLKKAILRLRGIETHGLHVSFFRRVAGAYGMTPKETSKLKKLAEEDTMMFAREFVAAG